MYMFKDESGKLGNQCFSKDLILEEWEMWKLLILGRGGSLIGYRNHY